MIPDPSHELKGLNSRLSRSMYKPLLEKGGSSGMAGGGGSSNILRVICIGNKQILLDPPPPPPWDKVDFNHCLIIAYLMMSPFVCFLLIQNH